MVLCQASNSEIKHMDIESLSGLKEGVRNKGVELSFG